MKSYDEWEKEQLTLDSWSMESIWAERAWDAAIKLMKEEREEEDIQWKGNHEKEDL